MILEESSKCGLPWHMQRRASIRAQVSLHNVVHFAPAPTMQKWEWNPQGIISQKWLISYLYVFNFFYLEITVRTHQNKQKTRLRSSINPNKFTYFRKNRWVVVDISYDDGERSIVAQFGRRPFSINKQL